MQDRVSFARLIEQLEAQVALAARYIDRQMVNNLQTSLEIERVKTQVIEATGVRPQTQEALLGLLDLMEERLVRMDRFYQLEYQRMQSEQETIEALVKLAGRLI